MEFPYGPFLAFLLSTSGPAVKLRSLMLVVSLFLAVGSAYAQGGPPYYTNDPGTPGNHNWEINIGYMPFLYSDQSVSHTPDLDLNYGIGDRIQLTYESAWLRVQNPGSPTKFGMNQSNPGVKWRFYDEGEDGLSISIFPQGYLNNPNHAVARGITPPYSSFEMPIEFSKKVGPVHADFEMGYELVHKGANGFITGLVVGRDITKKLELDAEFYSQGPFRASQVQPTFDFGGRYKLHYPIVLLFMAGRSFEPTRPNQTYFLGYFGIQLLLPHRSFEHE